MSYTQLFKRLMAFIAPVRGQVALAILLGAITVGASVGLMATSAWMISKAGISDSIHALGVAAVGVRGFGIARGVFRYVERLVSHNVTFKLLAELRVWFYRSIEPLAPAGLSQYRSGDLLGRVVSDVESLQEFYIRVIGPVFIAALTIIAMFVMFLFFDPLAAVVLLAFMLAAGTALPLFSWWQAHQPGQRFVKKRADLSTALIDAVQGMPDAVAYGQAQQQFAQLQQLNNDLAVEETRLARLDGFQMAAGLLLLHMASLAVLFVAIPRVDSIYLATLVLATIAAFEAITPLAAAATSLGTTLAAGERVFEIVDTEPTTNEPEQSPTPHNSELVVRNLIFRYASDAKPVLNDISLTLHPGQRIAIVGSSGAGKTSIANVLLRFWDYESGTITLGGHSLHDYRRDDISQHISLMSQRTHLFNTSIRENIAIAKSDATDEEVIAAAQKARIHEFISSLPDGYHTYTGESGTRISGGERQRIALARVLLRDSLITILDEATANLDAITEQSVLQDLYTATDGQALLVITHRLVMLDQMDEILVMHEGEIVERGTQDTLLMQQGMYYQMWHSQRQMLVREIEGVK